MRAHASLARVPTLLVLIAGAGLAGGACDPPVDDDDDDADPDEEQQEPAPIAPRLVTTTVADAPLGRAFGTGAVLDGKLYVVGGGTGFDFTVTDQVDVYDVAADTWSQAAPFPAPRSGPVAIAAAGKLYVTGGIVGGSERQDRVDIYDPATNTWEEGPPMPAARHEHAGVAVGDKLYVLGGFSGRTFDYENTNFIFDTASRTWSEGAPLPRQRHGGQAVLVDGKVWLLGGNDLDATVRIIDVYDPQTDTWTIADVALREERFDPQVAAIGAFIIVTGGSTYGGPDVGTQFSGTVEVVDTEAVWSSYDEPFGTTIIAGAAASAGTEAFFLGGINIDCSCATSQVRRVRLSGR